MLEIQDEKYNMIPFFAEHRTLTHTVYLSGPMTAVNWGEAEGWRNYAANSFTENNIRTYTPLRGKEFLSKLKTIGDYDTAVNKDGIGNGFAVDSAILHRDFHDVSVSDLILVNLWGAPEVSIGTVAEIAWAHQNRTPIVGFWEGKANPHNHPFIRQMIPFMVEGNDPEIALDEAIDISKTILLG